MSQQPDDAVRVEVGDQSVSTENASAISEEALVYRMVGVYLSRKLKSKYQLEWKSVKDNPAKRSDYDEMREKLAREAFLAVRSRTGQDFIDYFASTICSVSQTMREPRFVALTRALLEDTDKVRTLTLLALSARS